MADQDTPMHDAEAAADPGGPDTELLLLSESEQQVLELYDRLKTLQLQIALVEARLEYKLDSSGEVTAEHIKAAQVQFLKTRASYMSRNDVVDSVMTVNPILKAVHHATKASPLERDLLPYIEQRDAVSQSVAKQSLELRAVLDELTRVETESLQLSRQNAELAAQVLQLAREAEHGGAESAPDAGAKRDLERLEAQMKSSRKRWRLMKGTASAIVAGSGVDWAGDPELRDIVLDPE